MFAESKEDKMADDWINGKRRSLNNHLRDCGQV